MTKEEMTDLIIASKKAKGLTWEAIAKKVNLGQTWVTSACFGMNSTSEEVAKGLCEILELGDDVCTALQEFPHKSWDKKIPQDPVVYRFYEIVGVYGDTIKETIAEKFGDGIMSAIDFSMDIDKQEDPKGDRVVITLNGKFLRYTSW
ncbi:Cyanate hydratase [hydrothermal vent metagenome]|uniref:Cyanate hydratase n=1 Tax=hydrothermal vent metagenome TaxID=652676 RepID=A0A3B0WNM6_9ZZZZ